MKRRVQASWWKRLLLGFEEHIAPDASGRVSLASDSPPSVPRPITGVRVTINDGAAHAVDSSEMAFKTAALMGFREAYEKAGPTILEPIMKVEIAVPDEYAGAVMGDLSSRRGRPQGMEPKGSLQLIRAEVPLAEMLSYDAAASVVSVSGATTVPPGPETTAKTISFGNG